MTDQKNTLLAILLSLVVLVGWQYFFGLGQVHQPPKGPQTQQAPAGGAQTQQAPAGGANAPVPGQAPNTAAAPKVLTRAEALKQSGDRIAIETPSLKGSIALKGARIDDVLLTQYQETVDRNSPLIELLSPSGSRNPFYAEFGWLSAGGASVKVPDSATVWRQDGSGALTPDHAVVLTYDNGDGLTFRRTISVDDKYLFEIKDEVVNKGGQAVTLYPYGLVSQHGTPPAAGTFGVHEGGIGDLGDQGLQEITYKKMVEEKKKSFSNVTNAWLGITDKYWAAVLIPDAKSTLTSANFSVGEDAGTTTYQSDYVMPQQVIAPGATVSASTHLFAGAKEVHVLNTYKRDLGLKLFDRLINWGRFWFIAEPMFEFIDWIYRWVGNFGIAILIVTVAIKLVFFPLANKSYASMAKMKAVQPLVQKLREQYPDDKAKQQQEMMAIYKRQKINPVAGCLPIAIQIPVFYGLYAVLVTTIEMRHAPFFGWIRDLSAPDPTNVFTLFGLIPWDPTAMPMVGSFLHVGIWPLIMGVTMWAQMKVNPPPPDPAQRVMFAWMPVIFTFMLANFSAGLVIYWAWNNTLSVTQQSIIMKKHGVKIELWNNVRDIWPKGLWDKLKALLQNNRTKL
jgi:YidC/Oxa1 family membrane protein insertase